MKYYLMASCLYLGGCTTGAVDTANRVAIASCVTNSAAVSVLADLRRAGQLSPTVISLVNKDIGLTDPVCSSPSTAPAVNVLQQAAFAELKSLAGVK